MTVLTAKFNFFRTLCFKVNITLPGLIFLSISGAAIDPYVKYLVPPAHGKKLEKAIFFKHAGNDNFYFRMTLSRDPKIPRKEIVIDLPPKNESLKPTDVVLMPVEYPGGKGANATCGPENHDMYLNGTLLATQDKVKGESLWLVKSYYTRTCSTFFCS